MNINRTYCGSFKKCIQVICVFILLSTIGCSTSYESIYNSTESNRYAARDVETLYSFSSHLSVSPDSILSLYHLYDQKTFYRDYQSQIAFVFAFIDSMNTSLSPGETIDTLSIEHALGGFGTAARAGHTIFISSSYFFVFNDNVLLQSIVTHEFGHIHYLRLTEQQKGTVSKIWKELKDIGLISLFRDGEYPHNVWFGGHPEDNPSELFASAYNILHLNPVDFRARLSHVNQEHSQIMNTLESLVTYKKPSQ